MIRVALPAHLRRLAGVSGEVRLEVPGLQQAFQVGGDGAFFRLVTLERLADLATEMKQHRSKRARVGVALQRPSFGDSR